jgi:hypothetical protein
MRTLRVILGIPAIVLLFLPYTFNTSPWGAVHGWGEFFGGPQIALLGGPFSLSVLIFMAEAQLFLKKSLPKTERAICRTLAYAALACPLVFMTLGVRDNGFNEEIIRAFLIFGIPFLIAVSLMFLARRLGPEKATLVTLRAAWLPNAIICGIMFWADDRGNLSVVPFRWQIGAYLAAFTIVLYAVEVTLFLTRKEGLPERIASLASAL